jgi:hypothetical protein
MSVIGVTREVVPGDSGEAGAGGDLVVLGACVQPELRASDATTVAMSVRPRRDSAIYRT